MFYEIEAASQKAVALEAMGEVTKDDYKLVLMPKIDAAVKKYGKARLLIWLGPNYRGYTAGAAIDDAIVGMEHWRDFERIAIVTSNKRARAAIRLFKQLLPSETRLFEDSEIGEALNWV